MTDLTPIILTNLNQLPDGFHPMFTAATFELALAEYERRYGKAAKCWQYQSTFYFEDTKEKTE